MVCRTYTIEKAPTPGFLLTASQYEGAGAFDTTLHIAYPAGANQLFRIVVTDPVAEDSCLSTDILLDTSGNVDILYPVSNSHVIYVIQKTGTGNENCCTSFSQTLCKYSNYVQFIVTPTGSLNVTSTPSGAQIWLAPTGETPIYQNVDTPGIISDLAVGSYDYILKLTGYNDYTGNVTILEDQTVNVSATFIPAEGCILFSSSPQGARIWLAPTGQPLVDQGIDTQALICNLDAPGDYSYKLVLSGYNEVTGTASLGTGQGQTITRNLSESPIVSDIIISPQNPSVIVGTEQAFSAIPKDQYGDPISVPVSWSSNNTYVGNIDPVNGTFSALHQGTSIITAIADSISRNTTVTVLPSVPVLDKIILTPSTLSITTGNAGIFVATALDQFGDPFPATIVWNSSNPGVGTIDQNGVFTGVSVGTSVISATSGSIVGIAIANVTSAAPTGGIGGIFGNINEASLLMTLGIVTTGMMLSSRKGLF